jgi:hypothetical protein
MTAADANRLRLKAARCLELAANLPTDAPAAEQLRLFASEFAEMATQRRLSLRCNPPRRVCPGRLLLRSPYQGRSLRGGSREGLSRVPSHRC